MKMIKRIKDIKAHIRTDWQYSGRGRIPKFMPGDFVLVKSLHSETFPARYFLLKRGEVVAVTCASDGKLRGHNTHYGRAYTKYYVRFGDKTIRGFHSNNLE